MAVSATAARCCIGRYIELLAVVDPNASSATLDRFLARYAGIHILAFAIDDPQAALARLRRAGIEAPSVAHFDRAIDDMDPAGPRARFELIQLPDQPEGRINLVRHLTPEALWQERFLHHCEQCDDVGRGGACEWRSPRKRRHVFRGSSDAW